MSGSAIDYEALAKQSGAIASTPAPPPQPSSTPVSGSGGIDYDALAVQSGAINHFEGSGQTTNGAGTLITPKDDESFASTMERAAAFGQTAQAKAEAAKESTAKNLGTKAAETLAAAPVIGAAGTAALALPGAAINAGAEALTPHVIRMGEWAVEHPVAAKALYTVIKDTALGAAGLGLLKKGLEIGLAGK